MTHEEKLLLAKQFLGKRYVFHPSRRIQKTTTEPDDLLMQPGRSGLSKHPTPQQSV